MSMMEGAAGGAAAGTMIAPGIGTVIGAGLGAAGGYMSGQRSQSQADANMYMQLQFAKHGLQWKVEDAKKAGIHPLYALGAPTHSFSPVSLGGDDLGSGLSRAGQDISRSLMATATGRERSDAYTDAVKVLSLRRLGLENDLLSSQIAKTNQAGQPPGLPDSVPVGDAEETKPTFFGAPHMPPRNISPAQGVEDEYGEWVGDSSGFYRFMKMMERETALGRGLHDWYRWANENTSRSQEVARSGWTYRNSADWRGHY